MSPPPACTITHLRLPPRSPPPPPAGAPLAAEEGPPVHEREGTSRRGPDRAGGVGGVLGGQASAATGTGAEAPRGRAGDDGESSVHLKFDSCC